MAEIKKRFKKRRDKNDPKLKEFEKYRRKNPLPPKKDVFGNVIDEGILDKISDIINEPFLRYTKRAKGGLMKGRPKLAKKGF